MTTMSVRDIHARQLRVLAYVVEHPDCKRAEVDALVGGGRDTARFVLESLYCRGLIARLHRLDDGRNWYWRATDAGHEAVERGLLVEVVA